ncbi:MAG: hypothetical protein GY797_29405 [Deltaproteobacteria bacterium]|nr:hypothetical protein [Deltaproteobacteria bacterium]
MNKHCLFLVLCFALLLSVVTQASAMIALQHDDNLKVWIKEMSWQGDSLRILFQIGNLSYTTPLWICTTHNHKRPYPVFESNIVKNEGKVFLKIKSVIVPNGVHLYEPVCARYQKIPIRNMIDFELHVRFPISQESPFINKQRELLLKKLEVYGIEYEALYSDDELMDWAFTDLELYETTVSFKELQQLNIELGYYKRWFFYRDIWGEATCSVKTPENEICINCFWAMRNPEQTITLTLNKKTVEQFLQ